MKRKFLALLLILICLPLVLNAAPVKAKEKIADKWLEKANELLKLDDAETAKLEKIASNYQTPLREYFAELSIIKAQIQKELLPENPDMEKIKPLIKASLVQEEKIQMLRIQRQIELRKLLGNTRWASLTKMLRLLEDNKGKPGTKQKVLPKKLQSILEMLKD